VWQILKRHYASYTPEMVERVCGVPQDVFARICRLFVENSGRERTTAFVHGVGWTQHTIGSQYIRAASILQLLLGNMGRPGGGVMAMRGHASIQGSSDIPTLFDTLPGYIPMPAARGHDDLDMFIAADAPQRGFWGNMRDYTVSLLKAWWGAAATAENDYCFGYLPRLTGTHSTYDTVMEQVKGTVKGYVLFGQNPAVGSANTRMQRLGMSKLDWLVVRDFSLIESATWWKDGPEIESGEMRTEDIGTEVFFFPAAAHIEKDGTFTNTQRMVQWHHKAQEPQADQRSDLWFTFHLGRRIRERLRGSGDDMDRPVLELTWDYPTEGAHDEPLAAARRRDARRLPRAARRRLDVLRLLDLLRRLRRRRQPDRAPQARQRAELDRPRVGLGVADEPAHPLQPRLGRPRRAPVERAQGAGLVGRRAGPLGRPRRPRLRGHQAARLPAGGRRHRP
jgi:formate dehydrogenase major subunit